MRKVVLTISMLTFVVAGINAQEEEVQNAPDFNKLGNPKILSHSWKSGKSNFDLKLSSLPEIPNATLPPDMVWNMPNVAKTETYARIMRDRYGSNQMLKNPVFKGQRMNKDKPGTKK